MQLAQILLRAYRLAKFDTYPCHTGWPIRSYPCHTGRANAVGPNHFSVPYRSPDPILSMPYRWANAVGPNNFSVPYRSAGSDTYPCIQVGQCSSLIIAPCHTVGRIRYLSVPYRSANAVDPNHSPCHTGWPDPIPIRVIQVGQCTWPESFLRGIRVGRITILSASYRWPDPIPILVIQVSQPSWLKSFLCAIHVGQYSFPNHSPMSYQLPECTT